MAVAFFVLVTVLPLTVLAPLGGCLVTDDIEFRAQEDAPPTFVFRPPSSPVAVGETLRLDTARLESEGTTNVTFNLQVRDENLLQDLETQVRLRTLVSPSFSEVLIKDAEVGPIVLGSGRAVRDVEFSLLTTELRDGHCHQLQLAVSGGFLQLEDFRLFGVPRVDGDVAIATWWLWETSPDTPVNPATCPTDEL